MKNQDEKPQVKEVKRDGNKVVAVSIEFGPFQMDFIQKERKTVLWSFKRFDESRDEPDWIPPHYFKPAIRIARGIFHSARKRQKPQQARLFPE